MQEETPEEKRKRELDEGWYLEWKKQKGINTTNKNPQDEDSCAPILVKTTAICLFITYHFIALIR